MTSVEIIPGEMRLWTDRASAVRPPAGGAPSVAVLSDLLTASGPRVLVVGPHDDLVLDALADRDVTVLLRSLSDSEEHRAARPAHRVVCGDLASFTETGWDLVVALDGVERVGSNDRPATSWQERLDLLTALVGPTGTLLLGVDNPSGGQVLADARPLAERRECGDWEPPRETDASRPRSLGEATRALAEVGLTGHAYAAGWSPTRPAVLAVPDAHDLRVRAALLADRASLGVLELLFDPTPYVLDRVGQGRLDEVCGGWVLAAGRGAVPTLPDAVLADGDDLLASTGPAPAGVLVAERAVDLVQREDLVALRTLVAGYLDWLAGTGRWSSPEATAVDGQAFAPVLGPGPEVADRGELAARACRWLAHRLLAPDLRRVWPPWMSVDAVARTLAAMGGITLAPDDLDGADDTRADLPFVIEDVRTLAALNRQLREELVSARGEVLAHERLATARDRQLENRSVRLERAERKAEKATERAERAEADLRAFQARPVVRALRAVRRPGAAFRALRNRARR